MDQIVADRKVHNNCRNKEENMKKIFIMIFIAIGVFIFAYSNNALADPVTLQWTSSCSGSWTFSLDIQSVPTSAGDIYTLDGIATSTYSYPVRGGAIYDPVENAYMVTLIFTSESGETFTFGAALDTTTVSGPGTSQRIAHGSVDSDCSGTLSVGP